MDFVHERMHRKLACHSKLWRYIGRTDDESKRALESIFAEVFSEIDDACVDEVAKSRNGSRKVEVNSGTTALVAIIAANVMHVAHVGDTRAVVCRGDSAIRLTKDHKPNLPTERKRIVAAGGAVIFSGCWRAACTVRPVVWLMFVACFVLGCAIFLLFRSQLV